MRDAWDADFGFVLILLTECDINSCSLERTNNPQSPSSSDPFSLVYDGFGIFLLLS